MPKLASAFVAAVLGLSSLPAMATPVCLDTVRIDRTSVPDSSHIVFQMRDGSKWSNALKHACPGLVFNRFSYEPAAGRDVCENIQIIHVLDDNSACVLGKFTKIAPARTL